VPLLFSAIFSLFGYISMAETQTLECLEKSNYYSELAELAMTPVGGG
jgi:hypothetical protein